ncbi:MAG: protein kinase [Gemmataceae bacterium]|nr:protein kinase [Gemmataceae bacterium]
MSAPAAGADRNLLFGTLAVQMNFISRDALINAINAWVLDKQKPLGMILLDQKVLPADTCQLLDALVQKHLDMHGGDPEKSLAAVNAARSIRNDLGQIADPAVQACITRDFSGAADPFATRSGSQAGQAFPGVRFRVLRPHARGGLGEVFVAEDLELHRQVALKEIQARFADDAASRTRFLLEAEVTGGLEHPGIVPVYGLGQYADGRPFYAMRFIQGDSLKEAIGHFHTGDWRRREGERALAFRELLGRFVDVCNAIAYAHSRGVLHRDLKPGNIMLGKYGETLVVDWGLAKSLDGQEKIQELEEQPLKPLSRSSAAETIPGTALGTPQFMSPEQAAGRLDLIGPAADIYGLGATLYCVLTGRPPFAEADTGKVLQQVRQGRFPQPRQVSRGVPRALEAVCLKAMALKPSERYPDAHFLADEIEHWLADEPVFAYRESWAKRGRRWIRRHQIAVTATSVLLLVGLSAAGLLLRERARTEEAERLGASARVEALLHAKADAVPRALEELAPVRALAMPTLRKTRDDPQLSRSVCIRAALGLLSTDPTQVGFLSEHMLHKVDPQEAIAPVLDLLPHDDALVRQAVLDALGGIQAKDAATLKAIVGALEHDKSSKVRVAAAVALAEIGPAAKSTVPALVKALQADKNSRVRTEAAQALGAIGVNDATVLDALRAARKDKDADVREEAEAALKMLRPAPDKD